MSAHPHTPGPSNDVIDGEEIKLSGSLSIREENDPGFNLIRGQTIDLHVRGEIVGIAEKDKQDGNRRVTVREILVKGYSLMETDLIAQPEPRARHDGQIHGQQRLGVEPPEPREPEERKASTVAASVLLTGRGVLGATAAATAAAVAPNGDVLATGAKYLHPKLGEVAIAPRATQDELRATIGDVIAVYDADGQIHALPPSDYGQMALAEEVAAAAPEEPEAEAEGDHAGDHHAAMSDAAGLNDGPLTDPDDAREAFSDGE